MPDDTPAAVSHPAALVELATTDTARKLPTFTDMFWYVWDRRSNILGAAVAGVGYCATSGLLSIKTTAACALAAGFVHACGFGKK